MQVSVAHIWVAEISVVRSSIGYAVGLTSHLGLDAEMEIKHLYLLYRFHRNGLGQPLMNEILAAARQNRGATLLLKVHENNQNSIDFYSRNGFCVIGEKRFLAGTTDYKVLLMKLALGTKELTLGEYAAQIPEAPSDGS
ncbi:MAG TPA: GNAT family N-acetyltransferase [Edaphobacter sp.]|nr:GNAT family N-acetyltransferase [Edaphobacter sp.]